MAGVNVGESTFNAFFDLKAAVLSAMARVRMHAADKNENWDVLLKMIEIKFALPLALEEIVAWFQDSDLSCRETIGRLMKRAPLS